MPDDTVTMRAISPLEASQERATAEQRLRAWIDCFVMFPTEDNLIGIIAPARKYQTAWMQDVSARAKY